MFCLNVIYFCQVRRSDREEIRRRLASGFDDAEIGVPNGVGAHNRPVRRHGFHSRLQHHHHHHGSSQTTMNLQVCFVNEASNDLDPSAEPVVVKEVRVGDETVSKSCLISNTHSESGTTSLLVSYCKYIYCILKYKLYAYEKSKYFLLIHFIL